MNDRAGTRLTKKDVSPGTTRTYMFCRVDAHLVFQQLGLKEKCVRARLTFVKLLDKVPCRRATDPNHSPVLSHIPNNKYVDKHATPHHISVKFFGGT